jgi:hypothetical protein
VLACWEACECHTYITAYIQQVSTTVQQQSRTSITTCPGRHSLSNSCPCAPVPLSKRSVPLPLLQVPPFSDNCPASAPAVAHAELIALGCSCADTNSRWRQVLCCDVLCFISEPAACLCRCSCCAGFLRLPGASLQVCSTWTHLWALACGAASAPASAICPPAAAACSNGRGLPSCTGHRTGWALAWADESCR